MFKHINVFLFERGFDLKVEKEFEQNTKTGKQMEWLIMPWKRISDYTRHHIKVRILVSDYSDRQKKSQDWKWENCDVP